MHNRFYIEEEISPYLGGEVELDSITNHVKAFRKKLGNEIKLYDGLGCVYLARITQISKKFTKVELLSKEIFIEKGIKINLFLPIITSHLMDQLLSRLCEMEISKIIPVITERSINFKNDKEIDGKLLKWNKISKGACVLAGKNFSTIINKPTNLNDSFITASKFNLKLIASSSASVFLKDYLTASVRDFYSKDFSVGLFIGPEGDFSGRELELSKDYNMMPVKLSNYIMSTFVASIYFVSNLTCFLLYGQ